MPKLTLAKLNEQHTEAESADKKVFQDQRTNIRLVSGDHYAKISDKISSALRSKTDVDPTQKLRLVKNHIQFITKTYRNGIVSLSGEIKFMPSNPSELQDQVVAEHANSIWNDIKKQSNYSKKKEYLIQDYVELGEVAAKIYFDAMAGELLGHEPMLDELGQPVVDEMGRTAPDLSKPVFMGSIVIDRLYGFDLLRDPSAKSFDEAAWVEIRKLTPIAHAKKLAKSEEDAKKIVEGVNNTFKVFDSSTGNYGVTKGKVEVRETYYRKCAEYPQGYYVFWTNDVILDEGPLPGGIFPIVFEAFDEYPTSPRGHSIIKILRPYQIEINRASSKVAEHQITLGDDKIITMGGSRVAHGGYLNGVRVLNVSGSAPQILAGRTGDQFMGYITNTIDEMYKVANLSMELEEKAGQVDPTTTLYMAMKQKKRFQLYSNKFARLEKNIAEIAINLAKEFYTDERIIPVIGKNQAVNIQEFKNASPMGYSIEAEEVSGDIDTMLGKQLTYQSILQYAGGALTREDIGKVIKNMPYANDKEVFSELTLDYENARSDIMALDRGEYPIINPDDNHAYILRAISNRQRQKDYQFLSPEIQQMYEQARQEHMQLDVQLKQQAQMAAAGFIPTTGFMVKCDMYSPDPKTGKTARLELWSDSIRWLVEKIQQQGTQVALTESQNPAILAEEGAMLAAQQTGVMLPEQPIQQPQ